MKKMKGIVVAMESSPFAAGQDPRTRFKHQSLMQDYEELHKETEAMKNKLQMTKEKKLTLLAEVQFLRRRYKSLIENQSRNPPPQRKFVLPPKSEIRSRSISKEKIYSGKEAALRRPVPGFDLNRKGKNYNKKEATLRKASPILDLNQKQKTISGKEAVLQNSTSILDLNPKERIYSGKEAIVRNMTPTFDLNQISREEEELQANGEPLRVEELKKSSIRGGSDEQHNDMKLSVCRNIGNGSSRAGKRKISWQDQVALRV